VAEVLFTPFESAGEPDTLNLRISEMIGRTGFFDALPDGAVVAVKVHPGEKNNVTYLRPTLARSVVDRLARRGARPFVTETTTLYCRERYTAEELVATAAWNGYSSESLGCPFIVADVEPDVIVPVEGEHLGDVGVAGSIASSDALVVLAHVTGHGWTAGLAGSLKQLGMGCTGRRSKAEVHLATTLTIDEELCIACGDCAAVCKGSAIDIGDDFAAFKDDCARCGVCIGACDQGAIGYSHDYGFFSRALAEAAAGVLTCMRGKPVVFVNVLADLTAHCDCEGFSEKPAFPDIGVIVSRDPVAADQAAADLINESQPEPGSSADVPEVENARDKLLALSGIEWWRQLEHAEVLGAGSREYDVKRV
jgi:uncharacterized Fe-S center protein